MNKSVSALIRLFALALLVVMALSLASCDKLPFDLEGIFKPDTDTGDDVPPECPHYNLLDSKCYDCGKIFESTVEELKLDKYTGSQLPEGSVSSQLYYVRATVKRVLDTDSGEMIIEDATGEIKVQAIFTESGTPYWQMFERPDECDEVLLHCTVKKVDGVWEINHAFLMEFEAVAAPMKVLTVAEALELCGESGNLTTERYYVRGKVKTVTNPAYGAMVIYDETGEISVYNTASEDGSIGYADMADKPVKGDEVLLYCTLQNFNGTKEIKSAWLIEFTHSEADVDLSKYTSMTIAEARDAKLGEKVKVTGVVARITYANGHKPAGVILVDSTSSIYVYDGDLAGQVKIGNTVEIAAEKTYWILDSEVSNAQKFGYVGANQLDSVILISNDNGNTDFDKSWITETTVKEIMDTPVSEDITNKIYKVTALVKKAPGSGFVNYYIDDLDGVTGSYVYTQCNGSDFGWLDQFDNKICTVYLVANNAKSGTSGCVWRFLPILVSDDGYVFDTTKAGEYAVKYHGVTQFIPSYTGDPAIELLTSVSSELLGFEGAVLSYSSSNEEVVYFSTDANGAIIFHCGKAGSATVTVKGSYNGTDYSETVEITVKENSQFETISIADAIAKNVGEEVIIKGIVGPSLVNKTGFYLFDESGMVAVTVDASVFETIAIGNEIVIKGKRDMWTASGKTFGQICVTNATVEANYYGNHDYLTITPITDKTLEYVYNLDEKDMSETTKLYVVTATVFVEETTYYTNIHLTNGTLNLRLYSSSANQYNWLKQFAGQEVTVELAVCNWNSKDYYTGCVLAVVLEDGTKVLNTLNFN